MNALETDDSLKKTTGKQSQEELFGLLRGVIEKMGAIYKEHSFKATAIPVKSGFCFVHGELCFIMDKRKKTREKNRLLRRALAPMDLEPYHIPPGVRDYITGKGA